MTLSKIGWFAPKPAAVTASDSSAGSPGVCRRDSRCAAHAMVFDFPDPAECCASRFTPGPVSPGRREQLRRPASHWWNRGNSGPLRPGLDPVVVEHVLDVHELDPSRSSHASRAHTRSHRYARAVPVRVRRVPRPPGRPGAVGALVERQEHGVLARQPGGHVHLVRVDREVHHHPVLEDQIVRVPVRAGTAPSRRSTVCPTVGFFNSAVAVGIPFTNSIRSSESCGLGLRVVQLPHHRQPVRLVLLPAAPGSGRSPGRRTPPGTPPRSLRLPTQHIHRAPRGDLLRHPLRDLRPRPSPHHPGAAHSCSHSSGCDTFRNATSSVGSSPSARSYDAGLPLRPAVRQQVRLDRRLERRLARHPLTPEPPAHSPPTHRTHPTPPPRSATA